MTSSGSKKRIDFSFVVLSTLFCPIVGFRVPSLTALSGVCVWQGLWTAMSLPSPLAPEPCITARIMGRTRFKFDKTLGSQTEP